MERKTTLDDLRRAAEALPPGSSIVLSREVLLEVLADNGANSPDADDTPTRLLTASEAAARLGMSRKLVYSRAPSWPFTRRIGSALRFDAAGLERWLARQRP